MSKSGLEDGAAYVSLKNAHTCATSVSTVSCLSVEEGSGGDPQRDGKQSDPDWEADEESLIGEEQDAWQEGAGVDADGLSGAEDEEYGDNVDGVSDVSFELDGDEDGDQCIGEENYWVLSINDDE